MASRAFSGVRVTRPVDIKPSAEGGYDRVSDLQETVRSLREFAETDWRQVGNEFGRRDRPDKRQFHDLFLRAKSIFAGKDTEIADALMVDIPTIDCWTSGELAPHPIGRRTYLRALANIGQEKLRTYSHSL